jgi:hypothetical protein
MSAGSYPFTVRQGNTVVRTFEMKDANGDPVDLTGSTVIFRAVYPFGAGTLRKSTADAGLVMRAALGEVDLTLTPEETRAMPLGAVTTYDIEHRVLGVQTTLAVGTITVLKGDNDDV